MRTLAYLLIIITLGGLLLIKGGALFIPLAYALFISFLLFPVCRQLERKGLKRPAAVGVAVLIAVVVLAVALTGLGFIISAFVSEWPLVSAKMTELIAKLTQALSELLGYSDAELRNKAAEIFRSKAGDMMQAGQNILVTLSEGLVLIILIPVYVFLLLFYRTRLVQAMLLLFPEQKRTSLREILELSIHTYFSFIKGMALVYLIVGLLNSLGLLIIGVPHPFFFGMLTAVMTFIPYVGILLAGSLPVAYAWMTYGTIWQPLAVVGVFFFVQYLEANVIFPWAVGRRLDMNTLATLIAIIVGGVIWGASGMILFVPFAAILKLVADRMEGREWKAVAGLLGN